MYLLMIVNVLLSYVVRSVYYQYTVSILLVYYCKYMIVVGDTGQNGFDPIPIDISPYREYRSSFDTIFRPHPCSHTSYY